MGRGNRDLFACVRTEGGLLPPDLLQRIAGRDRDLDGLTAEDYGLESGDRLNEAINRAWSRLLPAWVAFDEERTRLAEGRAATGMTRQRWLLPLLEELGYGRLSEVSAKTLRIEGPTGSEEKSFPISHFWKRSPLHLVGCGVDLDRRTTGVAGAARSSPHSLVQAFLNSGEEYLWGLVSNGLCLRLLRDSARLSRSAYLEFDLEAIFQGEAYSDFVLLWLTAHATRLAPRSPEVDEGTASERSEECRLEQWVRSAEQQGTRALDTLRAGVERAIQELGAGFLRHPANTALRERLRSGALDKDAYFRQVMRLVYRLLFLFTAEDRDLLRASDDHRVEDGNGERAGGERIAAHERYRQWYSTERLRRMAERRRGGPHPDLYRSVRVVMGALGSDRGAPELDLPALGGWLWSAEAMPDLGSAEIRNRDLLEAVRALAFSEQRGQLRAVDFRNLGSEELGSVYESLLELHPELEPEAAVFQLRSAAGSERKTTGSYYTPTSLIQCLLDSALDPVIEDRLREAEEEGRKSGRPAAERAETLAQALLSLRICDPACGSGHFLIAAAHRLARRVAAVRTGEAEPPPGAIRSCLREVIGRCLYGVDVNPMAVELCKVSLWLEALVPGRPLSFLDHHVRCGNSLLGTTPALLARGIPDEAFEPLTGDEKAYATARRRDNRAQMGSPAGGRGRGARKAAVPAEGGQTDLQMFFQQAADGPDAGGSFTLLRRELETVDDSTPEGVRRRESLFRQAEESEALRRRRTAADAWCAAFVWPMRPGAPEAVTTDVVRRLARGERALSEASRRELEELTHRYRFFHWDLAFPEVFRVRGDGMVTAAGERETGWEGGFDCVLGNPPWEHTELKEKEWLITRRPDLAAAGTGAARKQGIAALESSDPELYAQFVAAKRHHDGVGHMVSATGRYPLCGRGRINTYAVFAELMHGLVAEKGRAGIIVPSGIATDDTTKYFFADLVESGSLASLFDFENRRAIFPGVHRSYKFSLLTMRGSTRASGPRAAAEFAFFALDPADLRDPERRFNLSAADLALLNPNTRTCPIFRTRRDAEITKGIYQRVPVLIRENDPEGNPWGISFKQGLFNMTRDSGLFRTKEQLEKEGWKLEGNRFVRGEEVYLPLYEAKMVHHYDHRFGDYAMRAADSESTALPDVPVERLQDPRYSPLPRYWVPFAEVEERLAGKWNRGWLLGWRRVCRTTDVRSGVFSVAPRTGVGDSIFLMLPTPKYASTAPLLAACLCSLAFDFVVRQKVGGVNFSFFIMSQLPVPSPSAFQSALSHAPLTTADWLLPRVLELTYTAWDLQPFARDCGYDGPPFRWDEERRFQLRCELDAGLFHLYGIGREDVEYILETFPIVKRKDEKKWGEYRTKRVVLEGYDRMGA